jgi:hypothetical protein
MQKSPKNTKILKYKNSKLQKYEITPKLAESSAKYKNQGGNQNQ